ncbi:hypothetical protein AKJ09_08284 [Labilithrix luteola]|uniref:Uncharacterized protein n=1 Tax=Labilithrix luteola TaxID=1391654 RepID=A0A0K1Q712_9BACT|nr:hypothetical protein AKJ09_08284 [Labilithrix luteola]
MIGLSPNSPRNSARLIAHFTPTFSHLSSSPCGPRSRVSTAESQELLDDRIR